jgi:hypothetical protein
MMVRPFIMTGQPDFADKLAALCSIRGWDFIFREDSLKWTFRNTSTAIDASIRINVIPRPFFLRFARDDALDWTNFHTTCIA